MSATPTPGADYSLSINADSGYQSTTSGRCTPEQYGAAIAALHNKLTTTELRLLDVLRDARKVLATAIRTNVGIEGFDVSQHLTIKKMDEAIREAEAKQ
jgi:hypothetical protein